MSFGMNLQALRRRSGMTQEGLADALGVSRQSVSKWESDGSFPEMEKLVQLCDLFGCPLDMLVRGDVEAESSGEAADDSATREAGMAYDRHTRFAARAVTLGVGLVLFGVALLMLLYGMDPTDRMSIVGTALMLAFITAAAALFIVYGCRHEAFQKKYPEITVSPYTAEETERFDRRFPLFIAGGVALILLGVIFLVCCPLFIPRFETPSRASFATGLFLLILDAGVMLIVYGAMTKARYNTGEYNRSGRLEVGCGRPVERRDHAHRHRGLPADGVCLESLASGLGCVPDRRHSLRHRLLHPHRAQGGARGQGFLKQGQHRTGTEVAPSRAPAVSAFAEQCETRQARYWKRGQHRNRGRAKSVAGGQRFYGAEHDATGAIPEARTTPEPRSRQAGRRRSALLWSRTRRDRHDIGSADNAAPEPDRA